MKTLHLICNAHLDPVWQWQWEEGVSAAISTFATAARLADEFDYIFNHNEVLLYEWIKEYEPSLFERIRQLVKAGKWKIMGGWYLQPDCNLPCGESFVRQMQRGMEFFRKYFDSEPKTAVNVDPFGHSRGLVQIMKKCGFENYLVCRPLPNESDICDDFIWEGLDGSTIRTTRIGTFYHSAMGRAVEKIKIVLESRKDRDVDIMLWGVGNHGGGPSRKDLAEIQELMKTTEVHIIHSTPDDYFAESPNHVTTVAKSLNPVNVGCYTSMIRVKQLHRTLENELYAAEKMLAHAAYQKLISFPQEELLAAEKDLLLAQFHDILPGSCIRDAENDAIRLLEHGREIVSRLRARAFFAMLRGEERAEAGTFPIFVYNPHPYPVTAEIEAEFMLEDQNHSGTFSDMTVYSGEQRLPTQVVKERSNMRLDWRKRVAFTAELAPGSLCRFAAKKTVVEKWPVLPKIEGKTFVFENKYYRAEIDAESGYLTQYRPVGSPALIEKAAFVPALYSDNEDPWGQNPEQYKRMGEQVAEFAALSPKKSAAFSGKMKGTLPPVRIIESGEVLTAVEAVLGCSESKARIEYRFYRDLPYFDVHVDVMFFEKNKILKLKIPCACAKKFEGQIVFGREELPAAGEEVAAQQWVSLDDGNQMLAVYNDGIYGYSCKDGVLELSLLRGCAYTAYSEHEGQITRTDRYIARMEQGERNFRFRIHGGAAEKLYSALDREALEFSQQPFALNAYPAGKECEVSGCPVLLSDPDVTLVALRAEEKGGFMLRLQNDTTNEKTVHVKAFGKEADVRFTKFEVKTLIADDGGIAECGEMIL